MNLRSGFRVYFAVNIFHTPFSSNAAILEIISLLSQLVVMAATRLVPAGPANPPYALQSVLIDLAIVLYSTADQVHHPAILQAISYGVKSFADGMRFRLLLAIDRFLLQQYSTSHAQSHSNIDIPVTTIAVNSEDADATNSSISAHIHSQVIPLLLSDILESISVRSSSGTLFARHNLLRTLVKVKPDLPIDILYVIAYTSSSSARYCALRLLYTFWPNCLGHVSIGDYPPQLFSVEDGAYSELNRMHIPASIEHGIHHWIPWLYPEMSISHNSMLDDVHHKIANPLEARCRDCRKLVHGFALQCIGLHDPVHLQCYVAPEGSSVLHYMSETGQTKLSFSKFCLTPKNLRTSVFGIKEGIPSTTNINRHCLFLVTNLTCTVCFICKEPLWCATNCIARGLA